MAKPAASNPKTSLVREPTLEGSSIDQAIPALQAVAGVPLQMRIVNRVGTRSSMLHALYGLPSHFRVHQSPFCLGIKEKQLPDCRQSCLQQLPEQCLAQREPFLRTCHAGGHEVIVPVFHADLLAAIAYFGPFRLTQSEDLRLPLIDLASVERLKGLGFLLRAYLYELLDTPRFEAETDEVYREEIITRFMMLNMRSSPDLADLARELGLSTARTRQLVKESTGMSFSELWDRCRLERAKRLLTTTYHKVSIIAGECGFADRQYFYRFFRKQTGTTPAAYRRRSHSTD